MTQTDESVMILRRRYEEVVRALAVQVAQMRREGASAETAARAVHAERRRLTAAFKAATPEPWRARIGNRTMAIYGDAIGPTIEFLRARGRSWDEIIAGAGRPGSLPPWYGLSDATRPRERRRR